MRPSKHRVLELLNCLAGARPRYGLHFIIDNKPKDALLFFDVPGCMLRRVEVRFRIDFRRRIAASVMVFLMGSNRFICDKRLSFEPKPQLVFFN